MSERVEVEFTDGSKGYLTLPTQEQLDVEDAFHEEMCERFSFLFDDFR